MPGKNRLTNNSDETDVNSLLSGDTIFTIPYFQRPYKWQTDKLNQLHEDILRVVDESDLHFLGALIVHGRRSNPSDPDLFDVIDGQQRITTLYLYLAGIIRTLCKIKELDEAKGLYLKYLVIGRSIGHISNMKLHSCKEDRFQLNYVLKDILSDQDFEKSLGDAAKIKLLPPSGKDRGRLRNNYRQVLRLLDDQLQQAGVDRIREIYTAVLSAMSVVQIDVSDPTNGPKIFDSLNSRQEPMTIGDLVRNEVFSRIAAEELSAIDAVDEQHWQPFYKKFDSHGQSNLFEQFFFPFGLIQNHNLKKSEVYNALREIWKGTDDPETIIKSLKEYQNAFIDFVCGTNLQKHPRSIAGLLSNFSSLNAPSSVLPFAMQLSNAIRENVLSEKEGVEVLKVVESFLVRRAICGHEPTGLHAVFKRLWNDCGNKPTKDSVISNIRKHVTVVWPTTVELKKAIESRNLYGAGITPYVLMEYDRSLGGDQPKEQPWIEHVLPQTLSKEWLKVFNAGQHEKNEGLLANLIPLSAKMNISLSNKPYKDKRQVYLKDSMFKSAREFAKKITSWTPEALGKRSKELSKWAVVRWKH